MPNPLIFLPMKKAVLDIDDLVCALLAAACALNVALLHAFAASGW